MTQKGSWRDRLYEQASGKEEKQKTTNNKTGSWRDRLNIDNEKVVATQVTNMLNEWSKNYNSYVTDYQNRFSGRKGTMDDAYVGDSAEWLNSTKERKNALNEEADAILNYLNQYGGYLDEKWVSQIKQNIRSAKGSQIKIVDSAKKDNDYWNSFANTELLEKYGSAEEVYKYRQRTGDYYSKYQGLSADDIQWAIGFLDEGEEKDWLTSYAASVDYDEKSKADIGLIQQEIEELGKFYDEAYTIDLWYNEYQMGNEPYDAHKMEVYNKLVNEYGGDVDQVMSAINQKKAYIEDSNRIKELNTWSAVTGNEDFATNSGYVSTENNSWHSGLTSKFGMGYDDLIYEYINGKDNGMRSAITGKAVNMRDDTEIYEVLKQMTDQEISVYNYYYATGGKEKADEYLSVLNGTLKARKYAESARKAYEHANENWYQGVIGSIGSVATSLLSGFEYVGDLIDYGAQKLTGQDAKMDKNEFAIITNSTRQGVTDQVDWNVTSELLGIKDWDAFDFLYNTTMSGVDSMASMAFGPAAGLTLGLSAAAQGTNDALDRGMSSGQAFWNGLFSGAAEMIFESASIGNFRALKEIPAKTAKDIFKNLGKSMLVNASEETLTEIANIAYDTLINGEFANYTMEELKNGAWKQALNQVIEAGASGALMGVGMGAIANASGYSNNKKADNAALKQYGDKTDALINEGLSNDVNTESYKLAQEYKQQTDSGKALTGEQIRNLLAANQEQISNKTRQKIKETAVNRLTELGQTEDVSKIAELVVKRVTGQELSKTEKSVLARSQYGAQVAKDMLPQNITSEDIGKILKEIVNGTGNPAVYKALDKRVGEETKLEVSDSGKATISGTDQVIDLSKPEIVKFVRDKKSGEVTDMVLNLDGKQVKASEIDYADEDQAYLFEAVSKIENITPGDAQVIVRDYDPSSGLSVGEYLNGMDEAYTYGYHNYSEADMGAGNFAQKLSSEQAMSAYRLGQAARKSSVESDEATRKVMRTEADAKVSAEQKAARQKSLIESKDSDVYFISKEDGSISKFDEHTGKYDKKRMAAVNTAKFLTKLGIGGKYYFYESYVKDGVRVYKNANGNEVAAPNGMYKDSDGSIHIDLNAGEYGQGTALFTLGHELTHFVKDQSEKQFKILCDLVEEAYSKTDMSMHERVLAKQKFLEDVRGKSVSYSDAYEEVVADAMSTMLTDGTFHEKIMEIKVKDNGLFNTIKRFFEKLIAKFRKEYENLTPDQKDAQDIREMKDMFDRIQTAFAEALVDASDNFHAAMESVVEENAKPVEADEILTEGAVVTDGEGVRHSIRSMKHDIAEGKMFEDLKNVCGWTDAQVKTLRTQLSDLVEYMTPFRSILDMNETYGMEGRRFSPYKPNSDPLYKISMDFSTLCSKRLLTQYVIEQLQLRENRPMSAEEQMAIRDMLNEYRKVEKGLQVACAMCYVEAARLKSPKQVQRWLDDPAPLLKDYFGKKNKEFNDSVKKAQADFKESNGYDREAPKKDMKPADVKELNKIGPKMRSQYQMSAEEQAIVERAKSLPNSTYLTAGNLADLSETDPVIYDAYTAFVRTATRSKSLEKDEPYYYGDSTRDNGNGIVVTDSFIEAVNKENGMRFSSWSDWRIQHLLDYITAVIDNSVRGAAMHGYTKFGDEVRVLGKTGMMFNMSGVAGTQTGLNEDGSLNFSSTESIDVNEAIQLREEFPDTAGLQCIGVSDAHIVALLRSDIIDYVIPYHVSGLNAVLRRMVNIYGWADYTGTQHASIDKSIKFEDAVDKEHWHEEPVFSEFFVGYDTGMTGIEAMIASAEKYKQMCKNRGLKPKFEQFANEDNYWKLLIDRKMINQKTGNLIRQKAVTPTFEFDTIKGVVDKFVENYDAGLEARALNHVVENWDSIPQRIKDLKKQGGTKTKKTAKAVDTLSNQTLAAQPAKNSDRQNKKIPSKQQSAIVGRPVKQGGSNSTHNKMSSAAAAEILGMENIANFSDSVKNAISVLGTFYQSVDNRSAVMGFKKPISGRNLQGSLVSAGVLYRSGDGGSAYRKDGDHELRISNHSSHASNFKGTGEHLSVVLRGNRAINKFLANENNVIEVVFYKNELDKNPKMLKALISDIAHFIAFGEYHDTAGASVHLYSGSEEFKKKAKQRMEKDEVARGQKFSERGGSTSNRHLLANAFEGISQNSIEYTMIQEYKGRIKILNEYEEKLSELNAEIRKLTFGTEGERDSKKLKELQSKAKEIAEHINRNDKRLLSLEASDPLRKVIERERKKEAQKTKAHVKEIQQNKKVRAEQTELRHKVRKAVRDLDKILNRGNKKQNVKEDMKGFVSKALELADYLFTDHISNDELIRKGITVRMEPREAALVKETENILSQLYDNADSLTDEEFTRLDAKRKANEEKLRDLLTDQRNERLNVPVYNLFNDLVTEYASLKNSKQDAVKAAYDSNIERFLRSYIGEADGETDTDRKTLLQNMRVADMTTEELWKLHNAYKMVLHSIREANKLFVKGKTESIDQVVTQIVTDFGSRKIPEKKLAIAAQKLSNKIGWDYEKLYYALDRIGSDAFTELIMNIADSENIVMQDIIEAEAFRDEMVKKYGFNNWDVNKKIDKEFLDNTGKKFKLTLGELMSLYAYSRREGAWDHIEYGGFVFGEKALTDPKPADSYKLSKEQCKAITSLLTKEQKGYAEDMQKFLSETMGEKGNEVSMQLYGIKMFNEKNYFPVRVSGDFKPQANESQAKAEHGFHSMSNAGFTHAQNPNAKAPFMLDSFNEVWTDHVNEMSRYHGTVPALEDLRRVMNRSSYSENTAESTSVKVVMKNHFGEEAVKYFDNLYREANSGAISDRLEKWPKKLLSLQRKLSVVYKISVWIQQPTSIIRAYSMVDRKYFGFKGVGTITSSVVRTVGNKWTRAHTNAYNEMLKYAPGVTMAKEIGGFDTATGGSIRNYLLDTNKSLKQKWKTGNALEKGKAVLDVVDDNAIANLPNVADKIAWIEIWNACKRETVATHKDLAANSEAFMQAVGKRFTEVIRATQVYDSIFAKSPMLKSKNLAVQYLVSFMNEANTTANMVEKAVRDVAKWNKADVMKGLKTVHVVIHSIIFTNLLKSLVYALHDDDEDETYIEKYIEAVVGNVMTDLNPLSYIPYGRDVLSLMQGYDVERPDMSIISDAIDAFRKKANLDNADVENMTEEQLIELDKKQTEANWKLVESVAAFFGIPVKNIRREIMGVIDHARIASTNAGTITAQSAWDKAIESIPFMSGKSKQDKLYNAIVSGDKAYLGRLKSTYKTDSAYQSAVRKALRENDPRIKEAALAGVDGNSAERNRIFKEIKADLGAEYANMIVDAINSEANAIRNDAKPEKVTGKYEAYDFVEAVSTGDAKAAKNAMNDIIETYKANGKTQTAAEEAFVSDVKTAAKEAYSYELLDKAGAVNMLIEYADMEEEDATARVDYWDFLKENPNSDLSESKALGYVEFAEPAGVDLDMFEQVVNDTKGIKAIKDKWGDVEVTEREQILEVIDSLSVDWKQKDAIYLAYGLPESLLWDVPW